MAKTTYEYKLVKVPLEAIDHVNAIYEKRKAVKPETRKADVWIDIQKVKK